MSDAGDAPERTVIGIAFGNTTSGFAFTTPEGKVEVIANEEGDRQIPSVLSYVTGDEFHGAQAKSQLVRNPQNTIAYFRDFIGKKYSDIDPTNCHNSSHPVDVDGVPSFKIETEDGTETLSINEVTTRHLRRIKDSATDFLGKEVNAAVITVPTDFTDEHREALAKAAKGAGLEILQAIHEPVAAVLAYAAKEDLHPHDKTILVVDIGGTRSDAAVVASRGGMYTLIATTHDYELGGLHLDQVLVDHFAKEFIKKHKSDPRENAKALAKLKLECEQVKRTLSQGTSTTIGVESLHEGFDFQSTINRMRYDMIAKKVYDQITRLAENVVSKAGLDLLDIDEVILSGGSSHTPRVATRIAQLFTQKIAIHAPFTDTSALNPSELSARGAAIQASLISEFEIEDIQQSVHPAVTVAPHLSKAIGVAVSIDGTEHFQPVLPAQAALPARRIAEFEVPAEGGDVVVKFMEGDREIVTEKVEKPATNGEKGEGSDAEFEDSEDEEDEEIRKKLHKGENLLAEALIKDVKKGQKIEVTINVSADATLNIAARIVGTQTGVRGTVKSS